MNWLSGRELGQSDRGGGKRMETCVITIKLSEELQRSDSASSCVRRGDMRTAMRMITVCYPIEL